MTGEHEPATGADDGGLYAARAAILELTALRGPQASICPSEAARRLEPVNWRAHMAQVRAAARELARTGRIAILRAGAPVALDDVRGAVRLRIAQDSAPGGV